MGGWGPQRPFQARSPRTSCPGSLPWAPAARQALCPRGANSKPAEVPEPEEQGLVGANGQMMAPPWPEHRELLMEPQRGPAHWASGDVSLAETSGRGPPSHPAGTRPVSENMSCGEGQTEILPHPRFSWPISPSKPFSNLSSPDFPEAERGAERGITRQQARRGPGAGP